MQASRRTHRLGLHPASAALLVKNYSPLKRFKRQDLRDELDILLAEQMNALIRGTIASEQAREAFLHAIEGRFRRKKTVLEQRKYFQRHLLITLLGGVPSPAEDDLDLVLVYLRNRVLKGSLSLPEAKERMSRAVRLLDGGVQDQWMGALEVDVLGRPQKVVRRGRLRGLQESSAG